MWSAVGCYAVVKGYLRIRNPSPETNWLLFVDVLLTGVAFYSAFEAYRNKPVPAKRITRFERISSTVYGVFLISIGLTFLVFGCWLMREQWIKGTRWPRVNAVLIRKDILRAGARMVFQYEVKGYQLTGVGFRWGDEDAVRAALASYEPGTVQRISYDPEDPRRVEIVLGYSWESVKIQIFGIALGIGMIAVGVVAYRK